jgi:HK97 family phage major capsid protein
MPKRTLQELGAEIQTKSNRVNEIFDAADKRGDGENTSDEIGEIKKLNKEIEELETEAAELKAVQDIRQGNDDRRKRMKEPVNAPGFPGGKDGPAQSSEYKTIGDMVLGDTKMAAWLKEIAGDGYAPANGVSLQSPRVMVKSLLGDRAMKTLLTGTSGSTAATSTSGGALVFSDRKPIVDQSYARPLTLRDIITIGETGSDTVEYVRVTGVTNAAAPTAEATATAGASGTKPESAMALARIIEPVKTIPHWIPATNRALADAPQLRTIIDTFLRYGIDEELEDQIITGNGTGENFTGVLNLAGTTAQAFTTDILTTTRKGRTKVRVTGRATPTAWVMHPNDWETIDLLQDNEGRYFYGGPSVLGSPRLWGLPVVECEGMTEGNAVVADWRLCVLWERMQTMISMSNSHSDFFIRNLIAILAEMRAALGWLRPKAFVICDLTA